MVEANKYVVSSTFLAYLRSQNGWIEALRRERVLNFLVKNMYRVLLKLDGSQAQWFTQS